MKFHVPEITCAHCVRTITRALQSINAEARVDVDIAAKLVSVEGALTAEQVVAALAANDYPATQVMTDAASAPGANCCGSCRA